MKTYNTNDIIRHSPILLLAEPHESNRLYNVGTKVRHEQEGLWQLDDINRTFVRNDPHWLIPDQEVQMTQDYVIVQARFGGWEQDLTSWALYFKHAATIRPEEFDMWIERTRRLEGFGKPRK
jgi:hypothetical protein